MAHGKETPRQKMIGMMYLVLTAMLAMNVSADLLNAFSLVDSGLTQTTKNYADKNAKTFSRFVEAELMNPTKVGPSKAKAEQIHQQANEIYEFVKAQKYRIIEQAEGANSPAILPDGEVDGNLIETKANTEIPSRVMIQEGNGAKLKEMLTSYRELILSMLDTALDKQLYESIALMLHTNAPPPTKDGIQHSWESYRFEHIPLIATLPQLTKVQVDVLNAEADVMNYLLTQIDAGDFKFNRIGAVVIPSSDYVMRGSEFRAEIFLAASDTTQRPKVFVGPYDSTYNSSTGEWVYSMRPGHENDTIPVSSTGRGILRRQATSNGRVSWSGLIEITGPGGSYIRKPFRHSYTVAEPSLAVSPTKMNVLYLGVDNPVDVSVSGVSMDKVTVTMSGGSIRKSGNSFVAKPSPGSRACEVVVYAQDGGVRKRMGVKKFRVKKVPDPVPTIFGVKPNVNTIDKGMLISAQGVVAQMPPDFDFDMKFRVLGFKIGVTVGGFFSEQASSGPQLTAKQKQLISNLNPGQQLTITDIRAMGPDGVERTLQPKVYKVR